MRTLKRTTLLCVFFLFLISYINAQCADKTGFARKACEAQNGNTPSASSTINSLTEPTKFEALTTNYEDSIHAETLPPTMGPKEFKPLANLNRADDGSFILETGAFEAYVEGYLLNYGPPPTKEGAFFPAPFKGQRAKIVQAALKQAELHPEIPQAAIQALLGAIIANADIENMASPLQQAALTLLPQDQLKQLQGATAAHAAQRALGGILRDQMKKHGIDQKIDAEQAAIGNSAGYKDVAGVMGNIAVQPISMLPTLKGSWVLMPGNFYVRYLPDGFSKVRVQVMVKDVDKAHPLTFDPTAFVAVLGATPSQRLGITMREVK
jgi:hypothetical protein